MYVTHLNQGGMAIGMTTKPPVSVNMRYRNVPIPCTLAFFARN